MPFAQYAASAIARATEPRRTGLLTSSVRAVQRVGREQAPGLGLPVEDGAGKPEDDLRKLRQLIA